MTFHRSPKIAPRLEIWRRAMIDLTRRNKLLNFQPSKASTVESSKLRLDER